MIFGIDAALIGSLVFGIPICGYAIWKDCKAKKNAPVVEKKTVTKEIEAKDGSIIRIEVAKEGVKK